MPDKKKTLGYRIARKVAEYKLMPFGISISLLNKMFLKNKNANGEVWEVLKDWYWGLVDNDTLVNAIKGLAFSYFRHNKTNYDMLNLQGYKRGKLKKELQLLSIEKYHKFTGSKNKDKYLSDRLKTQKVKYL